MDAAAFGPQPLFWQVLSELKRCGESRMSGRQRGPWEGQKGRGGGWRPGGQWPPGGWPPGFGGQGPWEGGRPRAAKGDVRLAILALLAEGPRHGYQVIQDIEARSGGGWRPSAGSVYPALSVLQDEGLVDDQKIEGRRVYSLTEPGLAYVSAHEAEIAAVFQPFRDEQVTDGGNLEDFGKLLFGVGAAGLQLVRAGNPEQVAAARRLLVDVRRDLYRLLADDTTEEEAGPDQFRPRPDGRGGTDSGGAGPGGAA